MDYELGKAAKKKKGFEVSNTKGNILEKTTAMGTRNEKCTHKKFSIPVNKTPNINCTFLFATHIRKLAFYRQ